MVSLVNRDRPFIEFTVTLRGNELLNQLVFPVQRQPFVFNLQHELSKGEHISLSLSDSIQDCINSDLNK